MLSLIHKLQRKPERVRRKAALITAAALTGIVVVFWLLNVSLIEVPSAASESRASVGPFRALSDGVGAMLAETRATVEDITDLFTEESPDAASAVSTPESSDSE